MSTSSVPALDQQSANWIFQVVSRRYEKGSIVLTSNRGFGDWNQVFADPVVASAIIDRLLHNASVLDIRGHSYRMRGYAAQQKEKKEVLECADPARDLCTIHDQSCALSVSASRGVMRWWGVRIHPRARTG